MVVLDLRDGVDPLRGLTRQLVDAADRPDRGKSFGVYFLSAESVFSPLARFVEREVFLKRFGNDDTTMEVEYGPFDSASDFILCVDHAVEEPTGVLRLIRPNREGLKTLHDVAAEPRWAASEDQFIELHQPAGGMAGVHDLVTFAVRDDWTAASSAAQSSYALYAGLYRWCVANDIDLLIGAIDEAVADLLDALSVPLAPLCGLPAIDYLGSPATRPYVISVGEARRRMRDDAALRAVLTGDAVERNFSFPPIELDAPDADLQAELLRDQPLSSPR